MSSDTLETRQYRVDFPDTDQCPQQDQEWCWLEPVAGAERQKLRFHDYDEIYEIPGLYEHIFYDRLECNSPVMVCNLLREAVEANGQTMKELKVLDLGAGNGMVGEYLKKLGVAKVIGLDILPEARKATLRDRPGIYEDYVVADLTAPEVPDLSAYSCDTLCQVAGLGFGDIPPRAFATAFNAIKTPGWLAFNIKEDFLTRSDSTGFSGLIHQMIHEGIIEVNLKTHYRHRLSVSGEPLYYEVIVARKHADIPSDWVS